MQIPLRRKRFHAFDEDDFTASMKTFLVFHAS